MAQCIRPAVERDRALVLLPRKRGFWGNPVVSSSMECRYLPCQWIEGVDEDGDRLFRLLVNGFAGTAQVVSLDAPDVVEEEVELNGLAKRWVGNGLRLVDQ